MIPKFAYVEWLALLRRIPRLHAVRVSNRFEVVNRNITQLIKRGYLNPFQFRFKRMRDGSCLIFHYSIEGFGRVIKANPHRRTYDWEAVFSAIPPGHAREINATPDTVRWAIWRYERDGVIRRGTYTLIETRERGRTREILCHLEKRRTRG